MTNQLKDREYAIIEADRTLSIENTLTDKQRIEIDELQRDNTRMELSL